MYLLILLLNMVILGTSLKANEKIKFNSQVCQDEFVCTMLYDLLGKQDTGYYLEIGAGEPISLNNTYVLEKKFSWLGLSIDISDGLLIHWHEARNNPFLLADATKLDYSSLLREFPQVFDYLSLDVDSRAIA